MSSTDPEQPGRHRPLALDDVGGGVDVGLSPASPPPVYPHADEPWAPYYLYQNPGWASPRDEYSRWKLGSSRKATAVATWELREQARAEYVVTCGPDPEQWPERHLTVVVFPTNLPTAVCLECLWLDGSHWEDRGARVAGRLHSVEPGASR